MKKYQYQIIRYVHDHFTGEFVNVGVVVYSKEERFLASKITNKYQRITQMFPEANGKLVVHILNKFKLSLNKIALELDELFAPSDFLEQITNSILIRDNNAIQFSEARMAIDVNLESAIDDLYNSQVEKYVVSKLAKVTLLDDEVWRLNYKNYFEKYGVDKRLQEHIVKVPKDFISFDKSWKNEIWHCYEPLSFVLKEKDSVKDKVYKWAGKLQGLQYAQEPLHLTLLTRISSNHEDLISFINAYLKVELGNLKVDIVTEDMAEQLAMKIQREMKLHDSLQ